ncbi:DsbA family protein [Aestuariivirga litoralis]|uniref:DsbA family protein n=1 Tax=Aestuariivirga litoralis TaxID=2650924 RepID=UPI0018C4A4A9|nr:DsbA family protein [Aestuariivirga litoralis]MBG1233337.1 DsbA family protein [Aestuariivirga litoralis]
MIELSRRQLLLGLSTVALSATCFGTFAFAQDTSTAVDGGSGKVDLSDLLTPPAEGDMTQGPDDAKVTIVEYGSASCPHCAAFYKDTYLKLKTDYIDTGKVRFIFREFPHNDQGLAAFMVARCAPKEKYFPLLDVFFTTQAVWVPDALVQLKNIAQQAGMSSDDFDACLKNEKVAKAILDVRDKGSKKYGVNGIPYIIINGKAFEGETSYDAVKAVIDPLLK